MNYNEIIYNSIKDYENISKCNFYELAKEIIDTQEKEIKLMKSML